MNWLNFGLSPLLPHWPAGVCARWMAEGKIGPLFSTVPGNELENEGRGTTPLSQDLFLLAAVSFPLRPCCLNTAGTYEFSRVLKQAADLSPCVSWPPHSLRPPQPDLTWLAEPNLLSPSFKLNLLSAPLKACFIGDGLVHSFKPNILSLTLQSTKC